MAFDLAIDSDIPVAGALPRIEARGGPDVRVRWLREVAPAATASSVWELTEEGLYFSPNGLARYRCTAGSVDVITPGADLPATVGDLLVATALPAMLWLRQDFVLHAAVVVPHGHATALAICGPSGAGKSTLAAELLKRGARLLADDSIAIRVRQGRSCAGLPGGYHLGADGAGDRRFHRLAPERTRRSAPLGTAIVLTDDPRVAEPRRLGALDAVTALLVNRHRPSVPLLCGFELRALEDAALLARNVPVYVWPRGMARALLDVALVQAIMEGGEVDGRHKLAAQ